jgi:hypothetical protein
VDLALPSPASNRSDGTSGADDRARLKRACGSCDDVHVTIALATADIFEIDVQPSTHLGRADVSDG